MPLVIGIQRREEYEHSDKGYSHYDRPVNSDKVVISKVEIGNETQIKIFLPSLEETSQGVGLLLPSCDIAIALGRALLTVSEGYSKKIEAHF